MRLRLYYRPGSKTGKVGDRFYAQRGDRLIVTKVKESHCAIPATRLSELMPKQGVSAERGEEAYSSEPTPFQTLDGCADLEEPASFDAAAAEADPGLSATLQLEDADSG
ncbi:hypothetical protein ACIBQ1_52715 [Nonomuraea sp. NPDC050153]|uniref:hypothetical protein n=1 Tax=Nonomuraea sp. NPDC050153 TaxID=3364359 RepID=UPI0037916538